VVAAHDEKAGGIISRVFQWPYPTTQQEAQTYPDTAAARKRIQEKDQARIRYTQTQFHCRPDDAHLYDLAFNTAILDLDHIVDEICLALEHKASRLRVPAEELGPAAGLARYPSQPADFPVP
jgi:cytidylate kinase